MGVVGVGALPTYRIQQHPLQPPTQPENANYYTLLRLPPPPAVLPVATVKKAYHAALLRHHPDKHSRSTLPPTSSSSSPSIDQITTAYKALSSPDLRREYDATLTQSGAGAVGSEVVQTVDLDAFTYEGEDRGRYVKSCRCWEEEGFVIDEVELERVAEEGSREVVVGCSLWWRVGFEVLDE